MNALKVSLVFLLALTCNPANESGSNPPEEKIFRQQMRKLVEKISNYAKSTNPAFVIIPQNGHEIITENNDPTETPNTKYLNAINGLGREDLFYGYEEDNKATDSKISNGIIRFLKIYQKNRIKILTTDYTATRSDIDNSYSRNAALGFISFAAESRELDNLPGYPTKPFNENNSDITSLDEAQNFLYLLNPGNRNIFRNKASYLANLQNSNYDLLIIDAYFEEELLTTAEVASLKKKKNGGSRLVVAYMSIGEAEDYRYYWQAEWKSNLPPWILQENNEFAGNFIVEYWQPEWQAIIFGNDNSYLKKILMAGFDGVYLDIIDAYEYFEEQK